MAGSLGKLISTQKIGGPSIFGQATISWYQVPSAVPPAKNTGAERAFPNGQYGTMIPQVYGIGRVAGNILWYGESTEIPAVPVGAGETAPATQFQATFAVAICRGPIAAVVRIWADDLLVYDATAGGPSLLYGGMTLYLGGETQTPDSVIESFEGSGNVPGYRGLAYMVCHNMPLKDFGNKIPSFSFEVRAQTSASVESVLNAMSAQTGLETTDFDFGCLDETVTGYIVTTRTAAKNHIDQLLSIFAGDLVEYGGKIQVVSRGGDALATIAEGDLGAKLWNGVDANPAAAIAVKRMQDLELPFRLDLNYYSANKGYDPTSTFAVRYDKGDVQGQVTVDSGLVLDEDEARQIAERLLYQQWIERTSFEFALMPAYLKFVPGAVLNLPVDGEEIRVRLIQMDISLFGPIGAVAVLDDTGILIQSVAGATVETTAPGLANPIVTHFHAFDSVEFSDADAASPGFYVASTGASGWRSADLYLSVDGGASYVQVARASARSIFGVTTGVLANGTVANDFDNTNTVTVTLTDAGILSNATEAAVRAGANLAYIGTELLGFTTATVVDLTTRTYTLSGLLRGLRSTPMTGHAGGEPFVLSSSSVVRVPVADSVVGSTVFVKALSPGLLLSSVTPQAVMISAPHTESVYGIFIPPLF